MLSTKSIEEYRNIRQEESGVVLSVEKAQEEAEALIRLYEAVFKPTNPHEESN